MNTIIPILHNGGKQAVDARELHAFLEVGKDFTTWIKDRIAAFGFSEGSDFTVSHHSPISGSGNRGAKIDYLVSLDMAKELSMVERSEKGKQARQYFIECESRLRGVLSAPQFAIPQTYSEALRALADETEKSERLEVAARIAAPKIEAFHRLAEADGSICPTDAAKLLQIRPKDLFAYLDSNEWTYRRAGKRERIPYQIRIQQGMMEMKAFTYHNDKTGEDEIAERALITPKGLAKLATIFGKSNAA